ncbi:MCE family protein [Amycolatopsis rhizosphaerae]|uniref:MCE family protein n=1 Tax=Amycolatopsis rhizosphaerae TaxID=2053003 RepID=A0A558D5K7_9PSEU|nr:MCE family protein [Amycolatopsis rhizosphaerae]TVT56288.1 MCE family protein [Amycolatopsis rhizosphaerae]
MKIFRHPRRSRLAALAAIVVLLAAAAVVVVHGTARTRHFTAYFTTAVGIYAGSEVRILGVPVGSVDRVEPQGQQVRVELSVDAQVPVPAGAGALVVTPSLVSDRYVQLSPAYTGGPELAGGSVIPVARTAVPVEVDQLFRSLDRLTTALGPDGANRAGALNDLLGSLAKDLAGNGQQFGDAVRQLGQAAVTLRDSQGDVFSTVDNIGRFTAMLAAHDDQIGRFADLLAQVSGYLAGERDTFGGALNELAGALGQIQGFVRDNRARVKSNVDKLLGTAQTLARQRDSLSEALSRAPVAMNRLLAAYDPAAATVDTRADLNEFSMGPPVLPLPGGGSN